MWTNTHYICHWLTVLFFLSVSTRLSAQFAGGQGDGFTARGIIQVTFDGVPAGTRAVYRGGPGDGFDRGDRTVALSGQSIAELYSGGRGDGFDRATVSISLDGFELSGLYTGGSGDGFDKGTVNLTLSGEEISILFAGGIGDGFDSEVTMLTLNGESFAGLFGGGAGDGFDHATENLLLNGTMLAGLYGGGSGDGFDFLSASVALAGLDLAQLFGGGEGDGFDYAYFAGVVPLPLTLISFDAIPGEQFVLLRWVTEDEVGTDFFTIEKTVSGQEFSIVGTTPAAGDSDPGVRLTYEMMDDEPFNGTSFYRLKTTDFDGAISLSHLVEVQYSDAVDWSFSLFPNPNTGRHFSILTEGVEPGDELTIEVFDAAGRSLHTQQYEHANNREKRIELSRRLVPGSYLIRARHEESGYLSKLLIVQ